MAESVRGEAEAAAAAAANSGPISVPTTGIGNCQLFFNAGDEFVLQEKWMLSRKRKNIHIHANASNKDAEKLEKYAFISYF